MDIRPALTKSQKKYLAGRYFIIFLIVLTVMSCLIASQNGPTFYLISIYSVFYLYIGYPGSAAAIIISVAVFIVFILSAILSYKYKIWMRIALYLLLADTGFIIYIMIKYSWFLSPFASIGSYTAFIIELVGHVIGIILIGIATANANKAFRAKKLLNPIDLNTQNRP